MKNRVTIGSVQTLSIPSLGVDSVVAKVDTGAWSGAIHCTHIREKDGELSFIPMGNKKLATSTKNFETREVRSANGHSSIRYRIPVEIVIGEHTYDTMIGLSDRTLMHREMLLGRRFLIENNILVDVALTVADDKEAQEEL